jgi:hypothetical protein
METNPHTAVPTAAIERELASVYRLYAALAQEIRPEFGLGGKLLYAGEPDEAGCRLIRSANIAGAAALAASADAALLRRVMREGVIDFVVTSLDEALRILKNEIRKRQTVAVGVSVAPEAIVSQMVERGVLPDLLAPDLPDGTKVFLAQGALRVEEMPLPEGKKLLAVEIPVVWAQQPAGFDALLMDHLAPDDHVNRRWVRLAPRFLGPQARRVRSLVCDRETAARLAECVAKAIPD